MTELAPKPQREIVPLDASIAGTDHINLPSWNNKKELFAWVRKKTRQGFVPLDVHYTYSSRQNQREFGKGLRRAQLIQDALLKVEDRNGYSRV